MVATSQPQDPAAAWARYLPDCAASMPTGWLGAESLKPAAAARRVVKLADGTVLKPLLG